MGAFIFENYGWDLTLGGGLLILWKQGESVNSMGGRGSASVKTGLANPNFNKQSAKQNASGGGGAVNEPAPARTFADTLAAEEEMRKFMDAEFSNWRTNLPLENVNAIQSYTNGDYILMNGYLRGKYSPSDSPEYIKRYAENLKGAFTHSLSKAITLYRGTGTTNQATFDDMTTVGNVFRDKGAFSTTIRKGMADSWAENKNNSIRFTVRLPAGYKNAIWIKDLSYHKGEDEVLIKPGQAWRVVKKAPPNKFGVTRVIIEPAD